ncbi:cytochrome c peroxidase [Oceanobacter mangrovi]|uniref:cytochrome c peroxidase n=1 Tax=Oceanobacter mangrovi TaxID=2862510 RepID=UPI001C8E2E5F|nr:cytochrome c peroxidase [Oceanobacter mangrovi]
MKQALAIAGLMLLSIVTGCGPAPSSTAPFSTTQVQPDKTREEASDFEWQLPAGVAPPLIPANNPMTRAKFELGRHLFYDSRLSAKGNIACASCHHQDKGFSDGRIKPAGTYGDVHPRNAQALGNTGWYGTLNWANPVTVTLERQIQIPMFGDTPFEHGLEEHNQQQILATLLADPVYQRLLTSAYPTPQQNWNYLRHLVPALATFVRGMTSFDAPWDHYLQGDNDALSSSAQRGLALFRSDELKCSQCHQANHFLTDSHISSLTGSHANGFHNNAAVVAYLYPNTGKHEATGKAEELGLFRTPSLRNIALTAPYMHDGSQPDLRSVIANYAAGGIRSDSTERGIKDPLIRGFTLTAAETDDLMAFLCSLTDSAFVTNVLYSNPWPDADGNPRPAPATPGVPSQCQRLSF